MTTPLRFLLLPLCLLGVLLTASTASASTCDGVSVGPATTVVSDAQRDALGLAIWPDTAFGVLRNADGSYAFSAQHGGTAATGRLVVTRGTLDNPVQGGVTSMAPVDNAPSGYTYIGGGPSYRDPSTGVTIRMLHLEKNLSSGTRFYSELHLGRVDPATGRTRYLGPIVTPTVDFRTADALNWTVDIGTSSMTVIGDYVYVYFPDSTVANNGTQIAVTALSVARAPIADVIAAAAQNRVVAWSKYYNGGWGSPALGGPSSEIRAGHGPWGPNVIRTADGATIMIAGISQHEMVLSSSPNGVTDWSSEVPLFREPSKFVIYPTLVAKDGDPAVAGSEFYLYYTQSDSWPNTDLWDNVGVKRRLVKCTAGRTPQQVAFIRYLGNYRHRTTTEPVNDPGWAPERGLAHYLLDAQLPGTRRVYECRNGADHYYASIDAACDSAQDALVSTLGWIYTSPPYARASALYSCVFTGSGDWLVSTDPNCEGATGKGLLGYALDSSKIAFSRFTNGNEHWETTGPVSSAYRRERTWFLEASEKPGTVALYSCSYPIPGGTNHFISVTSNCEGTNVTRLEGWIYTSPPPGVPSTPLYRCYWPSHYDHLLSESTGCDGLPGVIREGLMGYAQTG